MKARIACVLVLAGLGCGCEGENEACVKARNEASNVWKQVKDKAGGFKHKGALGYDELSKEQKAEHAKRWAAIEKQADMLHESFAFEKITWRTADPAKEKLNKLFGDYPQRADYGSFAATLAGANNKHEAARRACR